MNIAFIMNVYHEPFDMVEKNVLALKEFYPGCPIILIYDGVLIQNHQGVSEHKFDREKVPGKFGAWTHRYLKIFLDETTSDYAFKIDPDTNIIGKMKNLPDSTKPIIFCKIGNDEVTLGFAIGYTRPMVDILVKQEWLINKDMLWYHKYSQFQDYMLKTIVTKQNLLVQDRNDFVIVNNETNDTTFSHTSGSKCSNYA